MASAVEYPMHNSRVPLLQSIPRMMMLCLLHIGAQWRPPRYALSIYRIGVFAYNSLSHNTPLPIILLTLIAVTSFLCNVTNGVSIAFGVEVSVNYDV